jgi:2-keto-3-deoxy-L-rhamnonate aldolase RhmA
MLTFGAIVVISSLTLNSIAHIIAIHSRASAPVVRQSADTLNVTSKSIDLGAEMMIVADMK